MTLQLRAVAAQAGAQGTGRLVALAINMVTFAILLHRLEPIEFGHMSVALALEYIVGTLGALGIDKVVFRRLSVGEMDERDLGTALMLRFGLAAFTAVSFAIVVLLLPVGSALQAALLVACASQLWDPLVAPQQVLKARVALVPFAVADVAGSALTLGLLLAFAANGLSAAEAVASTVLANLVVWSGLAALAMRYMRPRLRVPGFLHRARGIMREGRTLAAGDAIVVGYYRMDVIALSVVVGGAAVGSYGAAYRFVDITMYAQTIIIGAFFPSIARAWRSDEGPRELLSRLVVLLVGVGALAFVSVVCVGPLVINHFGGDEYGDTLSLSALLMGATAVMFVNRLLIQSLIAGGFGGRQLVCWAGGILGAALTFPFAAAFGVNGVALAILVGECAVLGIAWYQVGLAREGSRPVMLPVNVLFVAAMAAALIADVLSDAGRWVLAGTLGAGVIAILAVNVMNDKTVRSAAA